MTEGFLLGGALIIGVCSACTLLQYAQREVNWFSFLTSLLGFVLSFGIIALVPYDVWGALALKGSKHGVEPVHVLVGSSWETIYWATFLLCWVLCPLLIEYEASGDFTILGKLRASLQRNAAWCAAYAVIGVLLLLWLTVGGHNSGISAWCIAASNAWGLLVLTVLMGYGLVAVPRHLWRLASPGQQLATLYCTAVGMDEARLSTQFELQDVITEARTEISGRSMQMWDPLLERAFNTLQATLEECELLHVELTNGARGPREAGGQGCGSVSRGGEDATRLESLGELHRALKQAGLEARRAACRWDDLVKRCLQLEDLEEQLYPSAVEMSAAWQGTCLHMFCRSSTMRTCWHSAMLLWLGALRPRALRLAGGLCGVLSGVIVLGQLTMFSETLSLSLLALPFREGHGFGLTQLLCIVPLSYMVCTAYWSVFRLKVAGWYGLYPNHNTDTTSLLWCSSTLARLAAPLCYHFLLLVQVKDTEFQAMMGQMNVVPVLGESFNQMFPAMVGFLCLCNLLNVYSRLVQLVGLEALEFEWAPTAMVNAGDLMAEGRRLVERERRRRSEDRGLTMEMTERGGEGGRTTMPLRLQVAQLIEEGTLPCDWNAHAPG